jgi:ABC-type sugar transport system ATPase subunit
MKRDELPVTSGSGLEVEALGKAFGKINALIAASFSVRPGEILAVTGPSGAGKSTLGRLLSGLCAADSGRVRLNGIELLGLAPQSRRVAHMFESFALYPNRSVIDNVASPLTSPAHRGRMTQQEIAARVQELLDLTEIAHLRERLPSQLSGGQKQRVALCRALVQDPSLFILDEPIGHLDAKLRHRLRADLRRRQRQMSAPTLWLTPDAVEAMAVADRIAVIHQGRIQQIASAEELVLQPANVIVARLVGDPAMNVIPEALFRDADPASSRLAGFRPCDAQLCAPEPGCAQLVGEVYTVEPFGKYTLVTVSIDKAQPLSRICCKLAAGAADLLTARPGETVGIQIDASLRLFFDSQTGQRIESPSLHS